LNKVLRNTVYLYIRMFITLLISLYTSRVILEVLGVMDFGIYNIVGGLVTMFSFLNSAMSTGTQRFLSYEMAKSDGLILNRVFNMSINVHFVIAVLIVLLAETAGLWFLYNKLVIPESRIYAASIVYQLSIATFVISIVSVPYYSLVISREKMNVFAFISILEAVLKLLIVSVLRYDWEDKLIVYGVLFFFVTLFIRFVYYCYCRKHFQESFFRIYWDRELFRSMLSFNGWNLIGNLSSVSYNQGVSLLLNVFFGPIINAARGICIQLNGALNGLVANLQTALNPQIIKTYAKRQYREMHELIFFGSKLSFFLLLLISLPVFINIEFVLGLWLKNVPEYTVSFCRLILIVSLIDSFSGPLGTAVLATSLVKRYHLIIGSLQLLILPVSYLFLRRGHDPDITLYVSVFFSIIMLGCRLKIANSLVKLSIRHFVTFVFLPMLTVCLISAFISYLVFISVSQDLVGFVISVGSSMLVTISLAYLVGTSREQRTKIKELLEILINRVLTFFR